MKRVRIFHDQDDDSSKKKSRKELIIDSYTITRVFEILIQSHYICVNDFRSSAFKIVLLGLGESEWNWLDFCYSHSNINLTEERCFQFTSSPWIRKGDGEMLHIEIRRFKIASLCPGQKGFSHRCGKVETHLFKTDCFPGFQEDERLFPGKKLHSPLRWIEKYLQHVQSVSWGNEQCWEVLISKSSKDTIMEVYYQLKRHVSKDGRVSLFQAFGYLGGNSNQSRPKYAFQEMLSQ